MPELIVYACPTGDLASQLEDYFLSAQRQVGPNAAHDYMPHCTLTGFFHDESESIPIYAQALTIALEHAQATRPEPVLAIIVMELQPEFHYLQLESHWVQTLIQDFAAHVQSPSRIDAIRLKDWLHLSLAYRFSVEQHASLKAIAEELIQLSAAVAWELRLYERSENVTTQPQTCHVRSAALRNHLCLTLSQLSAGQSGHLCLPRSSSMLHTGDSSGCALRMTFR